MDNTVTLIRTRVAAAAARTMSWIELDRQQLVVQWDAKSLWMRFCLGMAGQTRYDNELAHEGRRKIAERLLFKAKASVDEYSHRADVLELTDSEIDAIKGQWDE